MLGHKAKADLILTARGTGNQSGSLYSMLKLDPQLAIPGAGITTPSLAVLGCWFGHTESEMDFLLGLCLLQLTKTAEETAPVYLKVFLRK